MNKKSMWVLMAAAFVDMLGFAMVFPQLPLYAERLGAKPWLIGPLIASFSIAQLASAPLWGRVSDRYGRRPVLLIGLSGSAAAFIIFGFANSVWLLFMSRIVQGAGGGTTGVIQAYVSEVTEPSQRAKGLGWISAATSAGVSIGGTIGSLAFAAWGTEGPGLLAASLCALNVLFAWRFLPESKLDRVHQAPRRSVRAAVWHVIRYPFEPAPRLIWIYAVGMGAFASLTAVMVLYLNVRFGLNEKTIGWVFLYVASVSLVMRAVILGPLVDRLGETRVMRIGTLLLIAGLALYPLPATLISASLVIALVPIGQALLFPSVTSLATKRADPRELGQTMGVQQSFGGISRAVAPLWATAAYQFIGIASPFFIAAAIMAVVSVLAFRVPTTPIVPEPAPAD